MIVDGIAKLQPGGAIALGGAPRRRAGGAPAARAPAKDAPPAKDGAKAPSPKS